MTVTTAYRDRGHRLRVDGPGAQPRLPAGAELLPRAQLRAGAGRRQRHRRGPTATKRCDRSGSRRPWPTGSQVVEHADVDVVFVTAPNMLHVEMVEAAAANGKHVFCEKPVGGTPAQTVAAERAARRAGVISGVGYNYRWAPLVQYAKQLDRRR